MGKDHLPYSTDTIQKIHLRMADQELAIGTQAAARKSGMAMTEVHLEIGEQ